MNRVLVLDLNLDPTSGTIACTHPKLVFSETYKCSGHLRAVHPLRLISRDTGQAIETAIATDPAEKYDKFVAGKETCPADCRPFPRCGFCRKITWQEAQECHPHAETTHSMVLWWRFT